MEYGRPFEWDGPEKRKTCFLKDVNISWGQHVTVMFQIVSTLMEEVPAFALRMKNPWITGVEGREDTDWLLDDIA